MRDYYIKLERMILIVENIKKFIYEKLMEMGFLPEEFKNLDEKIYNMKIDSMLLERYCMSSATPYAGRTCFAPGIADNLFING